MHSHHLSPAVLRTRLIRGIDPCQIAKATILRQGETVCTVRAWHYRKTGAFAGLAMALSGTLADGGQSEHALIVSALPEGVRIEEEDVLQLDAGRYRIAGVAPWPAAGEPAVITLTLREL